MSTLPSQVMAERPRDVQRVEVTTNFFRGRPDRASSSCCSMKGSKASPRWWHGWSKRGGASPHSWPVCADAATSDGKYVGPRRVQGGPGARAAPRRSLHAAGAGGVVAYRLSLDCPLLEILSIKVASRKTKGRSYASSDQHERSWAVARGQRATGGCPVISGVRGGPSARRDQHPADDPGPDNGGAAEA